MGEVSKLKEALELFGFSEVEKNEQIKELNEIISIKVSNKVAELYPDFPDTVDQYEIEKYVTEHNLSVQISKIVNDISTEVMYDYIEKLLTEIDDKNRSKFIEIINA